MYFRYLKNFNCVYDILIIKRIICQNLIDFTQRELSLSTNYHQARRLTIMELR